MGAYPNLSDYSQGPGGPKPYDPSAPMLDATDPASAARVSNAFGAAVGVIRSGPIASGVSSALGVPSGSPPPPSAAQSAAKTATTNALASYPAYGNEGRSGGTAGYTGTSPVSTAAVADPMTYPQLAMSQQLYGQGNVNPNVVRQPLPTDVGTTDLVSGRTATPTGADGWARLNYGPNNVIVGNKTNGSPKINNFVGYGGPVNGPSPGGTAATGAGTPASPLEAMRARIDDLNSRADMYSKSGTLSGRIMSIGLSKQAARLHQQFANEVALQHGTAQLGLMAQQQYPSTLAHHAALQLALSGDRVGAMRLINAMEGHNADAPMVIPGPLGSTLHSPFGGQDTFIDMQGNQRTPGPATPLPNAFAK